MNILYDISKLITEIAPQQIMAPIGGPRPPMMTTALANKINMGRKLTMREFQAGQANRMVPGQIGLPPQIERKVYMQFNQNRR